MEKQTIKQMLFNTASEILAGVEGAHNMTEQAVQRLITDTQQQIVFSVEQMAQDLETIMGFSPDYALLTASQIAPKPVLYSLLIFQSTRSDTSVQKVNYEERYRLLAPEFTAFLFDQNIDNYNGSYHESNAIQRMIDKAAVRLADDPDFYRRGIDEVLQLSWNGTTAKDLPYELRGLGLLVPYIHWCRQHQVLFSQTADVLYTVADVLTNEHLTQLAYAGGDYATTSFQRYYDFVDSALGDYSRVVEENAEQSLARAMLRGQGFLMVSASHYLLQSAPDKASPTRSSRPRALRDLLQTYPELVELVRLAEALVRVGDDLGDLPIDLDTKAPNIFLGTSAVQQTFLKLSMLTTDYFDLEKILVEGRSHSKSGGQAMTILSEIEAMYYDTILDNANHYGYPDDLRAMVKVIRAVVCGSKINARYNDRIAALIGQSLAVNTTPNFLQ